MRRREHKSESETSKPNGMFIKPRVQRKLKVGEPNDKYEQEADQMASKVVSSGSEIGVQKKGTEEEVQQKPLASEVTPFVQKMEGAEEEPVQKMSEEEPVQKAEEEDSIQKSEEEESVQKMSEEEPVQKVEEEEPVQRKESSAAETHASSVENRINQSKGSGSKLDGKTKKEMESGFGNDFSDVNIHNDDHAAQLSQDLGAKAFTHGNDVYFNKGQYNPESSEGKHLLAHELTHTIQQKGMVQKKVQKVSKKLKDHDKGFLDVINESSGARYPLSYNAEVDFKKVNGGREYFTAQEWPHRGEESSVKGSGRFTTGRYDGPAVVKFWKSKNLLKFGNGITVKAHSMASDPVPTGTHDLMLPDYPHRYGYIEDSVFSYAWFRIGESSSRYLHIGNVTLGCITVGAAETGAPEDRKQWTAIYNYLINCRAGNNKSVGKIYVYE